MALAFPSVFLLTVLRLAVFLFAAMPGSPAQGQLNAAIAAEVEAFDTGSGLPGDSVLSLAQTRDGFLWVGTTAGLARFDGRTWRLFDRSSHPTLGSDEISSLESDGSGYLWVGTRGGGLYRFSGASFLPVSRPNQLGGPWDVTALLQQEDSLLWVGTPDDLLYLQPLANSLRYGLPGIEVSDLTIDPFDHVWASADRGLFRQVQLTFQTLSLPLGAESRAIHALAMTPEGELLIGRDDGLMIVRGRFRKSGLPQSAELVPGLAGPVWDLLLDERGPWIVATPAGVFRLDGDERTALLRRGPADAGGAEDADEPADQKAWRVHELLEDREGSLWVASSTGLYRIDGEETGAEVKLVVTLSADGVGQRPASRYLLPPQTTRLDVEVAAPTFLRPERIRTRARLEGRDDGWREETRLEYAELPAGTYLLRAQASLDGGETWSAQETMEIEIEPRLHQTVEFWLAVGGGLGAILAVVGGWIYFVRRRERLFAEMAEQEWREIQEESGLIDPDYDPAHLGDDHLDARSDDDDR